MFQALGYHKARKAAREEFLGSLAYFAQVLVEDTLEKITSELRFYAFTPAIKPGNRSIGSILADANQSVERLSKNLQKLKDLLDEAG
ncbi:hypothetical protein ACHAQJ_002431 [Trichoderma viride]